MKKDANNFKNLDLKTIVDDPFAEEKKAKPQVKEVKTEKEKVPKRKVSKKADELSFVELTDYVNTLPAELFKEKLSTIQVPQEFVEMIKQVSYETGKPAYHVATAIIQMGLSRMKGDITEMIQRKSKKKMNLI